VRRLRPRLGLSPLCPGVERAEPPSTAPARPRGRPPRPLSGPNQSARYECANAPSTPSSNGSRHRVPDPQDTDDLGSPLCVVDVLVDDPDADRAEIAPVKGCPPMRRRRPIGGAGLFAVMIGGHLLVTDPAWRSFSALTCPDTTYACAAVAHRHGKPGGATPCPPATAPSHFHLQRAPYGAGRPVEDSFVLGEVVVRGDGRRSVTTTPTGHSLRKVIGRYHATSPVSSRHEMAPASRTAVRHPAAHEDHPR
jgi:hypothetical protein